MSKRITKLFILGDNTTANSLNISSGLVRINSIGSATASTSSLYISPASTTVGSYSVTTTNANGTGFDGVVWYSIRIGA